MARFYTDEQFLLPVVEHLEALGHDVPTVQAAGNAGQGIPDDEVLAFAVERRRSILTLNRYDFVQLHRASSEHFGIIVCTNDVNWAQFAGRIHQAVTAEKSLAGKFIHITRPAKS